LAAFGIALLLFLVGAVHAADFAALSNLRVLLFFGMVTALVGLGQGLCILVGGIDLSLPYTMTGGAVLVGRLAGRGLPAIEIILIVFVLAVLAGLLNGWGVAFLKVPPIIMTLGTQGVLQGVLLLYTDGSGSAPAPQGLVNFVNSLFLGFPVPVWLWVGLIVVASLFLSRSTTGRKLYVIGNNITAAQLAGVRVRPVLVLPYVVSAVCGALAGILLMAYTGGAYLSLGDPYLFESAAVVAVGGASMLGGNGTYLGTVGGALVLTLMVSLLTLFSVGQAWLNIGYGAILLIALIIVAPPMLRIEEGVPRRREVRRGRG
jgi:ribose transport system permease protein